MSLEHFLRRFSQHFHTCIVDSLAQCLAAVCKDHGYGIDSSSNFRSLLLQMINNGSLDQIMKARTSLLLELYPEPLDGMLDCMGDVVDIICRSLNILFAADIRNACFEPPLQFRQLLFWPEPLPLIQKSIMDLPSATTFNGCTYVLKFIINSDEQTYTLPHINAIIKRPDGAW